MKQSNDKKYRTKLRLSEIDRILKRDRVIIPPLSRATLVNMCEEGIFETAGKAPTTLGWLVYEDSFEKWLYELDQANT